MSSRTLIKILAAHALSLTVLAGPLAAQSVAQTAPVTVIRQARVFDGTRIIGFRDVLISGGRIAFAPAHAAVRQLLAAGVPILAGTDAPNPGTAHGIAMHRELELLVAAGLSNAQALAAPQAHRARVLAR